MKRSLSRKARIRAGLPPEPLYRDIAPDHEPLALYDEAGSVVLCSDLPTTMMNRARKQARKVGVTLPSLLIALLQDAADKAAWGQFGKEAS